MTYAFESLLISLSQLNNLDPFNFSSVRDSENKSSVFDDVDQWDAVKLRSLSSLTSILNIPTFCLSAYDDPWQTDESENLVQHWIMQFTNLTILRLRFLDDHRIASAFDFVVICQRVYWPTLVELSLEGDITVFPRFPDGTYNDCNARVEGELATFLHNHPILEHLPI